MCSLNSGYTLRPALPSSQKIPKSIIRLNRKGGDLVHITVGRITYIVLVQTLNHAQSIGVT